MTVQEIKDAACGTDNYGKSKNVSIIGVQFVDTTDTLKKPEIIAESASMIPILSKMSTIGDYTVIELDFGNDFEELMHFYNILERYVEESLNNTESRFATGYMTIIPISLKGRYFIFNSTPYFWGCDPVASGEHSRILRLVFDAENVVFNESDMDEDNFENYIKNSENAESSDDNTSIDYSEESDKDEFEFKETELKFVDTEDEDYS